MIEDKRPFVERQLRDLLYGAATRAAVLGKRDARRARADRAGGHGRRRRGGTGAGALLGDRLPDAARERVDGARARVPAGAVPPLPMARTPFFCSGCPHNLSTRAPADQLVGAGIGCHALIWVDPPGTRGHLLGAPQMGGEGAQWIGMAPFTADAPLRPEHRRRHVPPLGLAGDPRAPSPPAPHHVPAALQRRDRDDRWPGGARPDGRRRADPLAGRPRASSG